MAGHDAITEADRAAVNAAIAEARDARYAALMQAEPRPAPGRTHGWRGGLAVAGAAIGAIIAIAASPAAGAAVGIVLAAIGALAGGPLALGLHRRKQRARAEEEAIDAFAARRSWQRVGALPVAGETPLLRQGDRQKPGWGLTGSAAGAAFRAGAYVYETDETVTTTDSEGRSHTETRTTSHPFVIAVVAAAPAGIPRCQIGGGRSEGIFARLASAFSNMRAVPLESVEVNSEFRVMVADESDDVAVRSRLTPGVQVAMLERGVGEWLVQGDAGVLLAARRGSLASDDLGGALDALAEALWWRDVLCGEPAGRVPDVAALHAAILGS